MKTVITWFLATAVFLTPAMATALPTHEIPPATADILMKKETDEIKLSYFPPSLLVKPRPIKQPGFKAEPKDKETIRKIKKFLKQNDGKIRRKRQVFT